MKSQRGADHEAGPEASQRQIQRPPAEVLYAQELQRLAQSDREPRPPGWALSPRAVRDFIVGDEARGLSRKFVGPTAAVERVIVGLLGSRGLMLIGEPGTAKSMLSELLAAAISGDSTLVIQGSAGITDEQVRYSWNYALLLARGPVPDALVPSALYRGMRDGKLVRFEELTRCSQEVQDILVSLLSEKMLQVAELGAPGSLFAAQGFNVIATANTRDRGVNEMSAALKRRFNFETIRPIADLAAETALVLRESERILAGAGVPPPRDGALVEALVTIFQELRAGRTREGATFERPSTVMSTAEAIALFCTACQASHSFGRGEVTPGEVVGHLRGTAIKDAEEDAERVQDYFRTVVKARAETSELWAAFYAARNRIAAG
jgi:MoxR-like ATPase